jgi:hypothetical protein
MSTLKLLRFQHGFILKEPSIIQEFKRYFCMVELHYRKELVTKDAPTGAIRESESRAKVTVGVLNR